MKRETLTMATILIMSGLFGIMDYLDRGKVGLMTLVLLACGTLYFSIMISERKVDTMFDFLKPKPKYPTWDDIPPWNESSSHGLPEPTVYPEVPKPNYLESDDGYTVGLDENNNTIVRVTCNYSTTTLTMNEAGVRQMIRLLEATLPHPAQTND